VRRAKALLASRSKEPAHTAPGRSGAESGRTDTQLVRRFQTARLDVLFIAARPWGEAEVIAARSPVPAAELPRPPDSPKRSDGDVDADDAAQCTRKQALDHVAAKNPVCRWLHASGYSFQRTRNTWCHTGHAIRKA